MDGHGYVQNGIYSMAFSHAHDRCGAELDIREGLRRHGHCNDAHSKGCVALMLLQAFVAQSDRSVCRNRTSKVRQMPCMNVNQRVDAGLHSIRGLGCEVGTNSNKRCPHVGINVGIDSANGTER